jgi:hypothetical protein
MSLGPGVGALNDAVSMRVAAPALGVLQNNTVTKATMAITNVFNVCFIFTLGFFGIT